jgi:hypothetical protein
MLHGNPFVFKTASQLRLGAEQSYALVAIIGKEMPHRSLSLSKTVYSVRYQRLMRCDLLRPFSPVEAVEVV